LNLVVLSTSFVVFLGCFTQSLTGFGVALITMSLLPSILGLQVATPLVALVGFVLEFLMLVRYREAIRIKSILGLVLFAMFAIPVGVVYFSKLNENIALFVLGLIIVAYALYALIGFRMPELGHPAWAWLFGFIGGLLGGAYNTSGPPAVVYGNCRKWSPEEFKSNLAGYFMVGSIVVVGTHLVSGNFTHTVWVNFWITFPALLLGFLLGQGMDKWLKPESFRKIVLVLLVMLGLRLMM